MVAKMLEFLAQSRTKQVHPKNAVEFFQVRRAAHGERLKLEPEALHVPRRGSRMNVVERRPQQVYEKKSQGKFKGQPLILKK